jgi:hypothetical protein
LVAPHVPPGLAAIIDRCLAKDPAQRYQSCADLDEALERVRGEASAVSVVPAAASRSPLLSATEAQEVLKRASELGEMTSAQAIPAVPRPRDAAADARRQEGFKTSILRDAAAEAGIDPRHVEQAFAERGLRPRPQADAPLPVKADRRAVNIPFELSRRPSRVFGEPSELIYEMVVQGEVREDDYDLMLSAVTHMTDRDGLSGAAASVGRTLTWNGVTRNKRELKVAIVPRGGRTTIRVAEGLKQTIGAIYGMICGIGTLGVGGATFGSMMAGGAAIGEAAATLAVISLVAFGIARTASDEFSKKRQAKARELLAALGAQAREIAPPGK